MAFSGVHNLELSIVSLFRMPVVANTQMNEPRMRPYFMAPNKAPSKQVTLPRTNSFPNAAENSSPKRPKATGTTIQMAMKARMTLP